VAEVKIVKEDVIREEISLSDLTTDCMFVYLEDGQIDVVRAQSMVKIFDEYYDAKKKITKIDFSGGRLNPKITNPKLS
jgi:hypothetical protein